MTLAFFRYVVSVPAPARRAVARRLRYCGTEITTPKPEEVTARCTGRKEDLAVEVTAPHGWTIRTEHGSLVLTVSNTDQQLSVAELGTTNSLIAALAAVDWAEPDQVDSAAVVDGPAEWNAEHSGRVYVSMHVDCG